MSKTLALHFQSMIYLRQYVGI